MKVYLVTEGSYSDDYHVYTVCSTQEKAERAKALYMADDIEEYELDAMPDAPVGMVLYEVKMNMHTGNTQYVTQRGADGADGRNIWVPEYETVLKPFGRPFQRMDRTERATDFVRFAVWARDEKHALKIANERRAAIIADNLWPCTYEQWKQLQAPALNQNEETK